MDEEKGVSKRRTVFTIRSMLRVGGYSSRAECRGNVYSQLDELLHLLLSDTG